MGRFSTSTGSGRPKTIMDQDYKKIKQKCMSSTRLFCDDLFELDVAGAKWLRPREIVNDPQFFVGGASRFDVIQGANSGCWLLVAMANLTMNPTLFNHVVPKDQSFSTNYAGIFRFNIWQCGKWIELVVDDRLPTKNGKLMFVHSKEKNEFWSALLEKAYAKLYGSYNEITTGWFTEAMVDFTGGIVESVPLSPPPGNLKTILIKALQKSSFICVFMINDPSVHELILKNGLIKGHAYSLNKVQTVNIGGKSVFLLRLRNPWGKLEWNGPWSDSSPEWKTVSADEKKKLGLVSENDGEFWMSLSDYIANFEYMDVCHLTPDLFENCDGHDKIRWESHFFKGDWTKGVTAGGVHMETIHLNPQYRVILRDSDDDSDNLCTVLIGLLQKNKSRKHWNTIGITAYHLKGPEKDSKKRLSNYYLNQNFGKSFSSKFKTWRELVVRDKWEPGVYCIIPSTYKPGEEGQYILRVFSEKGVSVEEINLSDSKVGAQFVDEIEPIQTQKRSQIPQQRLLQKNDDEITNFFKEVAGGENEIGWEGLQSILEFALTKPESEYLGFFQKVLSLVYKWLYGSLDEKTFTKAECRNMISALDDDNSGRLSLREFQILLRKLRCWESVFLNYSDSLSLMDKADLRTALTEGGYSVKPTDISTLVRQYSGNDGKLEFDDFVMCAFELFSTAPGTS